MAAYKNLDLSQVQKLGSALAATLKDRGALIGLTGELGAGKTTFIKSLAGHLGIKKIASPTFVIRHDHPLKQRHLYHLDFYRLGKPKQLADLGLLELVDQKNLVFIEWVEKFPEIENLCDIIITFKIKPGNLRDITIRSN